MKTGKNILRGILLVTLPLAVLCLFACQSVAALSGRIAHKTAANAPGHHVWKHNTTRADHLDSFPLNGRSKDLHLSPRFKYKAKTFFGVYNAGSHPADLVTIPAILRVVMLYKSILTRPAYYNFLFRYTPF